MNRFVWWYSTIVSVSCLCSNELAHDVQVTQWLDEESLTVMMMMMMMCR